MKKYFIFLRGINVGGHNLIRMNDLKITLTSLGLKNVNTLLTSGNVSFQTKETKVDQLVDKIKLSLFKNFSYNEDIFLRSHEEIQNLIQINPFKLVQISEQTRLYVTFILEESDYTLPIPQDTKEKDFIVLYSSKKEICSTLTLTKNMDTTKAMKILEKEYGKKLTTRNWNTVQKLLLL
jgi:uncharacterized protein (DUF1697 family)